MILLILCGSLYINLTAFLRINVLFCILRGDLFFSSTDITLKKKKVNVTFTKELRQNVRVACSSLLWQPCLAKQTSLLMAALPWLFQSLYLSMPSTEIKLTFHTPGGFGKEQLLQFRLVWMLLR